MLPSWLRATDREDFYIVDPEPLYYEWMSLIGITYDEIDQYWYEVLFQCAKMDAVRVLREKGLMPKDKSLVLIFESKKETLPDGTVKSKWNLKNFPDNRTVEEAVRDRAAKKWFKFFRGDLPGWT